MFFDSKDFQKVALSMANYRDWAQMASNAYLGQGANPSTEVTKIAKAEGLTPEQIRILSAEVNKTIHQEKFAAEDDKYHAANFPLVDAAEVVRSLQANGNIKVATWFPEPVLPDRSVDVFATGANEYEMSKVASEAADMKYQLKSAGEKAVRVKQDLEGRLELSKIAALSAEKMFMKTARKYVLGGDSSEERMKILGLIDHMCKHAKLVEHAREPLAKLSYVLGKEGLLLPGHAKKAVDHFMSKKADEKAPKEMISEWLQARVVNGDHPLYISLKTFKDKVNAFNLNQNRSQLVDDRLEILGQKIRAL